MIMMPTVFAEIAVHPYVAIAILSALSWLAVIGVVSIVWDALQVVGGL